MDMSVESSILKEVQDSIKNKKDENEKIYIDLCQNYLNLFLNDSQEKSENFKFQFSYDKHEKERRKFIYDYINRDVDFLKYLIDKEYDVSSISETLSKYEPFETVISSDPYLAAAYLTGYLDIKCNNDKCTFLKSVNIYDINGGLVFGKFNQNRECYYIKYTPFEDLIALIIKNNGILYEDLPNFHKYRFFACIRKEIYKPLNNIFESIRFMKHFDTKFHQNYVINKLFIYYPK